MLDATRKTLKRQLERRFTNLAEARHDVEVTRALLEEEQARVDDLNDWRREVLAERVPFVVFCQPRVVEAVDELPVHDVEPALLESPVPDCLSRPAAAPDDLRDLVEMIRDAPGRWFPELRRRLDQVDRFERIRRMLQWIRRRALARSRWTLQRRVLGYPTASIGRSLATVLDLREERMTELRRRIAVAPLPDLQSWRRGRQQLDEMVSVGDLVESREVRAGLSRAASQLLENIHRVAACLYEELGTVEPRIRVQWALRMSEFDRPVDLRELSVLPLWREVGSNERLERGDPLLRAELQALVNWLYEQVDHEDDEAVALISDVVRVCVLLASHAPVDRIVAGHIETATPVRVGGLVPLRIDPKALRIGMTVWLQKSGARVARGVITDLEERRASARIVQAEQEGVVLQAGDPVRVLDDLHEARPLRRVLGS